MVDDTSLMAAAMGRSRELVLSDSELRGHLVESAVGAHLLALAPQCGFTVSWWREGTSEVDFVVSDADVIVAIEVKSGRVKPLGGMTAFLKEHPKAMRLVVGGSGPSSCPLEDFLLDRALVPWAIG